VYSCYVMSYPTRPFQTEDPFKFVVSGTDWSSWQPQAGKIGSSINYQTDVLLGDSGWEGLLVAQCTDAFIGTITWTTGLQSQTACATLPP
jgi:hypothetical protein